ncbi:MAG: type II toxin-antitoxin system VapC family toxin [Anaerolineae bacterium CFX3]|jgi:predicted nucleic acid-binding protein|nr:type II toxin-antitoxin system VapC family toxin [Anaerolineae bacterium CFX3]MCQ3946209.1 VapC toxin family PIN domain ribonuclease [Anaerolineae bacterium]MCZ7550758.1 PIN domain-containing protein [Anaerolineales bacterium]GER79332.1 PIN domain ribonuclease, VapC toxin family [Candidatus Denitrolinea symbiosum]MDX9936168.1 PIN domain-containing protein [Anaerolineales bacterium]
MILLDTDVMVDILRGYEPAKEWLKTAQEIGIPGLVAMELIQGCQNAREQKQLEKSLSAYPLFWPDEDDCNRALTSFAFHHLSDKIGLLDALIAETAIGVDAELATFNVKHYRVLKGLRSVQPYAK